MSKRFIIYSLGTLLEILAIILLVPAAIAYFEISPLQFPNAFFDPRIFGFIIAIASSFLSGVFLLATAIGLFVFLRRKIEPQRIKLALIPFLGILLGSLVMISIAIISVYLVYYLAPTYVNCDLWLKSYFLERATKLVLVSDILSVVMFLITFTVGAGSFGVLLYNKKIINDAFVWTALASGILSIAKIGYFATGNAGVVFMFLASIGSIMFYFFICEMIYVIFKDHNEENNPKVKKSIDASLLE